MTSSKTTRPGVDLPRPFVLYYALGGGLGHLMRALAVARRLSRSVGGHHRILTNSVFAPTVLPFLATEPGLELCRIESPEAAVLALQSNGPPPDLLVVDTFPRGLLGELREPLATGVRCRRVLIGRRLHPDYFTRYRLASFVARHYDLVLEPGESAGYDGLPIITCPPFLLLRPEERLPRAEAFQAFGVTEPVILVVGSGTEDECRDWESQYHLLVRHSPPLPPIRLTLPASVRAPNSRSEACSLFPLARWLAGVRLVLGNAGYHLLHETRAAGVPRRLLARPRRYDRQAERLLPEECLEGDLLAAVQAALAESEGESRPGVYPDGAALAAERLAALLVGSGQL